jgi:hypothetical protein
MPTKSPDPKWFKRANYAAYMNSLDHLGWYRALEVRRSFRGNLEWEETQAPQPDALWDRFLEDIDPVHFSELKRSAPIEELSAESLAGRRGRALAYWNLVIPARGVTAIDLQADDNVLREAFESWLAAERQRTPLPIERRGRPAQNVEVTEHHLARWRQYQVLAVFDLDFWSEVFGKTEVTHAELAGLLEPDLLADPKEWGREARKALNEALACVDMLAYQARKGGPN